jgi:hypothetical protein
LKRNARCFSLYGDRVLVLVDTHVLILIKYLGMAVWRSSTVVFCTIGLWHVKPSWFGTDHWTLAWSSNFGLVQIYVQSYLRTLCCTLKKYYTFCMPVQICQRDTNGPPYKPSLLKSDRLHLHLQDLISLQVFQWIFLLNFWFLPQGTVIKTKMSILCFQW